MEFVILELYKKGQAHIILVMLSIWSKFYTNVIFTSRRDRKLAV